jgi:putative ABC transport system permease protein
MLKNYITVTFRNLLRHRSYSLLNIGGLAAGLATSILILLWLSDEVSFDRFHTSSRQLFRVIVEVSDVKVALTPPPLAESLRAELPEAISVTQIAGATRLFTSGDKNFEEKRIFFADTFFLKMFDFPLIKGNAKTALSQPDGLIMTEEMAVKYFGQVDPMGKVIQMDNTHSFTVTGVLKNIPNNSHLQFDFLLPMAFLATDSEFQKYYLWDYYNNIYTYVQFRPEVTSSSSHMDQISDRINQLYSRHEQNMKANFILQPIHDIHLKSGNLMADVTGNGNIQYVRIFSLVSVFILIVACINFMNLATARAVRRAKEVGMRKVLGAYKRQLIEQFMGEAMLISLISLFVALVLVTLSLPAFNALTEKDLSLRPQPGLVGGMLGIVLLTAILAGSYPALYLSKFHPIQSLKGTFRTGVKSVWFRNGLVVLQFVVTIVLVVATVTVHRQVQFIRHQNLGFDRENLLYVPMKADMFSHYQTLRTELEGSTIGEFTVTSDLPANINSATYDVEWQGKSENEQIVFPLISVDEYFVKTLGMTLLAGRSFSSEFIADSSNYIVNEKTLKIMNTDLSTAVGKKISVNGKQGTIIGVVQDFHFKPLQQIIEPLIMQLNTFGGFVMVRTRPSEVRATLEELENIFDKMNTIYPFEYSFLDQDFETLYRTESRISRISVVFAAMAIFIACLGLFGLSAFMVEKRVKEIGVRKVVGASVGSIVLLLSNNLVRLMIVAMILATPLAWYLMNLWLENYAYHISINAWPFILAGLTAVFTALLATSFQTLKAAMSNPVKSLRTE